jgi:hypothetical protein
MKLKAAEEREKEKKVSSFFFKGGQTVARSRWKETNSSQPCVEGGFQKKRAKPEPDVESVKLHPKKKYVPR